MVPSFLPTDDYKMSRIPDVDASDLADLRIPWNRGPRGWLTLFTMPQLVTVLIELAQRPETLNATAAPPDVGELVRHEIVRREWWDA